MPLPKIVGSQRDFSSGELDETIKRADENPIMKSGARQMLNWRILNTRAVNNRPGRTALFLESGRTELIYMPLPGNFYFLVFGNGYLRLYDFAGTQVFNSTVLGDGATAVPWTSSNWNQITYAIPQNTSSIYIFYAPGAPNNVPQVLTFSSGWSLASFAETIEGGGQKRTIFDRISPPGITLQPSAVTGAITLAFSSNVLHAGMSGTRLLYCGRQILINGVLSGSTATATVIEPLPPAQELSLTTTVGAFNIGDEIKGGTSGATGIVTATATTQQIFFATVAGTFNVSDSVTGATSGATGVVTAVVTGGTSVLITVALSTSTLFQVSEVVTGTHGSGTSGSVTGGTLIVQLLPNDTGFTPTFAASETVGGPSGSAIVSGAPTTVSPQAVAIWDDEVMNAFRGYPSSCFFDQSRLGLCNFPSLPSGIAWSAIGLPTDFYAEIAQPDNAIFEYVPSGSIPYYVQPGMESSEFVFCDNAIYYIPISVSSPLVPGSVAFIQLSAFGILANVQPRAAEQTIVFIRHGGGVVGAVQAPGMYYRPFIIDSISELHSHLFTASTAVSIAIPTASNQFEEMYIYISLANGTLVVGKYSMRQGLIEPGADGKPKVGWVPWQSGNSPVASVSWVSALLSTVIFDTTYNSVGLIEKLDNTQSLDAAISVNNLPAPFVVGGKGPLYAFPGPNSQVFLIDQGTLFLGVYNVDGNGWIIPNNRGGENLASTQLVAGFQWESVLEPFTPIANPGGDIGQRVKRRRASKMVAYVSSSTGFVLARLFSGPITPTSPALGTAINTMRIPAWNIGDNVEVPAPLREWAKQWRPLGRSYDPRYAVIKDTPGSLTLHEITFEVSA